MGDNSKISWTDASWNPVTGCSRVSEGCRHCYAEALSLRMKWTKLPWTKANAKENVVIHQDRLTQPLRWRRPRRVFVNSMSDLFAEEVPEHFIDKVFGIMGASGHHVFQVLTKRPERMAAYLAEDRRLRWAEAINGLHTGGDQAFDAIAYGKGPLPNVWLGTSVEDQRAADVRIPHLLKTPAAVRLLSCEPLLGPVDLEAALCVYDKHGEPSGPRASRDGSPVISWVIVGGESGPHHRPMDPAWARSLRDQCQEAGVAFFYKQSSGYRSESEPWITETDGSRWVWHQYPGELTPPQRVEGGAR